MPQKSGLQNSSCVIGNEPWLDRVLRKDLKSGNGWSVTSYLDTIITVITELSGAQHTYGLQLQGALTEKTVVSKEEKTLPTGS